MSNLFFLNIIFQLGVLFKFTLCDLEYNKNNFERDNYKTLSNKILKNGSMV